MKVHGVAAALIIATVVLRPAMAAASGINLTWGQSCWSDTPQSLERFTCDTNTLSAQMVVSFQLSADQPEFVGIELALDIKADSDALPDWWQFYNPNACRRTSLTVSADFTNIGASACADPWYGLAVGGIAAYRTIDTQPATVLPNTASLRVYYAIGDAEYLSADNEYFACRIAINGAHTVGDGACDGCAIHVAMVGSMRAVQSSGSFEYLDQKDNGCLEWQGPVACVCQICDPVRNVTWGAVKTLYR